MSRTTRTLGAALVACALTVPAVAAWGGAATAAPKEGRPTGAALAEVRKATRQYHDVDAAVAAGYVPVSPCEALPGAGGMGVHYLHPGLAADLEVIAERPEILLYEPRPDGSLQLVGVEWFAADAGQGRPSVDGVELDGPMPGHDPQMPTHYDLHAWIWKANPSGMFAAWNPNVTCPAGDGHAHAH